MQKLAENIWLVPGGNYGSVCSNVYVLEGGKGIWLIDSGTDAGRLGKELKNLKKPIEKVLLTHGHFDHVLGAAKGGWESLLAKEDLGHLEELNDAFAKVGKPANFKPLGEKRLKFGKFEIEIIRAPGHTPGSACFLEKKSGILFSGDTLFAEGGYGRTDLWGGDPQRMEKSLALLEKTPYSALAPGHGKVERRV